jgi:hypothetical protein
MDSLKIQNSTIGLVKVYIDKVLKTKSLETVRQYKLFNLISF